MKKSSAPFVVLGMVLLLVGLGAGVYLLMRIGDASPTEVPTEVQVLGSTTTTAPPTTRSLTPTTTAKGAATAPITTTTKAPTPTTARPTKDPNGFTVVKPTQLPKEAQQTLALVDKGGPYPYDRDGIVFQNRENILPRKSSGYYHEYTVVTPGSSDRGARRIIAGDGGERYYTADHYDSFVRVVAS